MDPADALPMLLHQRRHPLDPGKLTRLEEMVEELACRTPLWAMECNLDPKAAQVAFDTMSK